MKYIKKYEQQLLFKELPDYIELNHAVGSNSNICTFNIMSIFNYLKLDLTFLDEEKMKMSNNYNVDVLDFLNEILLNKYILFNRKDKTRNDPITTGIVESVIGFYGYNYDVYFLIKLKNIEEELLIDIETIIRLKNYDAYNKPLHKKVKIQKDAEIYNL